ncbi:hypothetical protein [Streptomyces sp. NL15-2K]|uniref:hypothetical protein n=1 Tax=Streptomyces sp. NL15-2K TaxID=376149 RepID=UPI000F57AF4E|nr:MULTISPECIES: hypothetical protein [Actinomycetes]WKX06885.1 hypothetical protein Q4V64_04995 [Kutzneria buriramensis]GCB44056.1 hypothetical protein SNL152K_1341 [Streptomyces sp. NL15-2K]
MSLDLSHGFFGEVQFNTQTVRQVFAANFLERAGTVRMSFPGRELSMWFDQPGVALVKHPDPAVARVEVTLGLFARLSDRSDEARALFTARGTIKDRKLLVGTETRACPSVDFKDAAPADIVQTFTTNSEYDDPVATAVRKVLQESPFALGPLADASGKRFYRTYFDVPNHPQGMLVMFIAAFGEPPTPPTVTERRFSSDAMLLVPDDLVKPAIDKGLAQAGLATLPAQLNPDVKVNSLQVSLQNGHIRIEGSGTNTTEVLSIPIETDFTFKAFVQPLVNADGTVGIHVISTQQDLVGAGSAFADFISAGALTRLMERLLPEAISGLSLGSISGLDFFASNTPRRDDSAPATPGSLPIIFANGMGIRFDVHVSMPNDIKPPYIRGHVDSKQFHVKGCQFGDLITFAHLRKFPSTTAALAAGFDGCAVCQPEFHVPEFGDLSIVVEHPEGVQPGLPVTVRATYAGDLVRFGVTLVPAAEEDVSAETIMSNGVPTHFLTFDHLVPADWTVLATAGTWSVETAVRVGTRVLAPDGSVEGKGTQLRATVGKPGLVQVIE